MLLLRLGIVKCTFYLIQSTATGVQRDRDDLASEDIFLTTRWPSSTYEAERLAENKRLCLQTHCHYNHIWSLASTNRHFLEPANPRIGQEPPAADDSHVSDGTDGSEPGVFGCVFLGNDNSLSTDGSASLRTRAEVQRKGLVWRWRWGVPV